MDDSLQRQLRAAGAGVSGDSVTPKDADSLAAVVRALAASRTRFAVSGSGAHGTGVTVVLSALKGVHAHAPSLTLRAEAGAEVAVVAAAAQREGLAVVGMPQRPTSQHVGSLIARGELPRRSLCGIEAVLASGERVTFGGGVLKDVVGYDLPALLLGSLGRLAMITAATLRLEPEAARTTVAQPAGANESGLSLLLPAFDPLGLLQPGS